jgi:predicted nucleotidyltransferase
MLSSLLNEDATMTMKEKITAILREHYSYLAATYGVRRIGLFGSFARGQPSETSDVDIFVEFEHPIGFRFIEFTEYLEGLPGKRIDVLTPAGIQAIRIDQVARNIKESILYV